MPVKKKSNSKKDSADDHSVVRNYVSSNIDVFNFTYFKPDISILSRGLANIPLEFTEAQLYSPINEVFLQLSESNANSTTFNYDNIAKAVISVGKDDELSDDESDDGKDKSSEQMNDDTEDEHLGGFITLLCADRLSGDSIVNRSFIKFSPLLDPIRYLVGKYDITDETLKQLPQYGSTDSHKKSRNPDNASYVDSMFSFLSSKMLHHHGFINALDCYGSLLGKKKRFTIDAIDDIDYLLENDFFIRNNNVLYETSNTFHNQVANHGSRSRKMAIQIHDDGLIDLGVEDVNIGESQVTIPDNTNESKKVISLEDIGDINEFVEMDDKSVSSAPSKRQRSESGNNDDNNLSDTRTKSARSGTTSCSSRTSHTGSNASSHSKSHHSSSSHTGSDDSGSRSDSTASEDAAFINIYDFPVNAIFLEECEATLDYLCAEDEDFGSEELCAALMQVIMSLIAFHKCFEFQHNDLHTNNIMYIPTKKQFLYYKVNGLHYKVPTYGRIFKIIDFGRATYKFRGNQMCSDSFHKDGDAHSQFNFGRCYNSSRPVVEPNNSFDLCRLGTSLIDFLIEELEDIETTKDPIVAMVADWCKDDRGRNVLWKANGDERYPGFKLYKMISRTVSKHTPISQLERPILERYKCARKNIKKGTTVMNIDALPSYVDAAPRV